MMSEAPDVAAYITQAPAERQAVLRKLRALYRKTHKGSAEVIDYGMPCYKRGDLLLGAFASQKQYIALYGFGKVIEKHKAELQGASLGKGCIRFRDLEKIDLSLIEQLLAEAAALKA